MFKLYFSLLSSFLMRPAMKVVTWIFIIRRKTMTMYICNCMIDAIKKKLSYTLSLYWQVERFLWIFLINGQVMVRWKEKEIDLYRWNKSVYFKIKMKLKKYRFCYVQLHVSLKWYLFYFIHYKNHKKYRKVISNIYLNNIQFKVHNKWFLYRVFISN